MKKLRFIIFFIIILFALTSKDKSASAQEISPTIAPRLYDSFKYEYMGNIITYQIKKLSTESTKGAVDVLYMKSGPDLSPELHIPAEVTYEGGIYQVTYINQLFNNSKHVTSVYIPETITNLTNNIFYGNTSLTEVYIPDTVKQIGPALFKGCTNIKSIRLPKDIKEIGGGTFNGCTSLESVIIPEGLTTVGNEAFKNCPNLDSLYLPASVKTIGRGVFDGSNITLLIDQDTYVAYYCKTNFLPFTYRSNSSDTDIALEGIIMKQRLLTLSSGKSDILSLQYYPSNTTANRTILWSSSDPLVATVDQDGSVTGIKPGSAVITAVVGSKSTKCIVTIRPYSPKSLSAVPSAIDRIMVTWKPVKYAKGYNLYRSTKPNSGFKFITDVNDTFYEDYNLDRNTTYYYKVLATNNTSKSGYSEVISAKPKIAAPKITASSASKNQIKLHWVGVRGAEGYDVYRSTSKTGTYKFYKSITTPYYFDTSVTKDKTYYYNVKAYYKDKSKKIYSEKSNSAHAIAKTPSTPKFVTLGTSKSDVYKILGKPAYTGKIRHDDMYFYVMYYEKEPWPRNWNTAALYLKEIDTEWVVFGWTSLYPGLKVSDGNETNSGTFTLGSTFEEVIKVMKTPYSFEMYGAATELYIFQTNYLEYDDGSLIIFSEDKKVIGWENKGCLKVKYGTTKPSNKTITIGSSLTDVLNSFGTPDGLGPYNSAYPSTLTYGDTILTFNEYQKLVGWENKNKLNLSIGVKLQNAPKAKFGSSLEEVIKAMGTPDTFYVNQQDQRTLDHMIYGNTRLFFDANEFVTYIERR